MARWDLRADAMSGDEVATRQVEVLNDASEIARIERTQYRDKWLVAAGRFRPCGCALFNYPFHASRS